MEFYIQINPCNPKELQEYLDILETKGLLNEIEVEKTQEIPVENTWTTNEDTCIEINYETIRDKMVALSRKGLSEQLVKILNKYGADKVSALKEEHFLSVMEDMEELENESRA